MTTPNHDGLESAKPDLQEQALVGKLEEFDDLAPDLFYGFRASFLELLVQSRAYDHWPPNTTPVRFVLVT
jgi:hypothetical protein